MEIKLETMLSLLEQGVSVEEILEDYPDLERTTSGPASPTPGLWWPMRTWAQSAWRRPNEVSGGRLRRGRAGSMLRELGREAAEVRRAGCRMTGDEILRWGEKEGRAVLTLDKDFGQLSVAAGKARTSIIRLPDVPAERRKELLALVLAKHAEDLEKGSVITVTESRIRVRRLP